jgi:hypothetical protein
LPSICVCRGSPGALESPACCGQIWHYRSREGKSHPGASGWLFRPDPDSSAPLRQPWEPRRDDLPPNRYSRLSRGSVNVAARRVVHRLDPPKLTRQSAHVQTGLFVPVASRRRGSHSVQGTSLREAPWTIRPPRQRTRKRGCEAAPLRTLPAPPHRSVEIDCHQPAAPIASHRNPNRPRATSRSHEGATVAAGRVSTGNEK